MKITKAQTATALPTVIEHEAEPLDDAEACLAYIRRYAPSRYEAFKRTIIVGILYVLTETIWAQDKASRKSVKFVNSELAAAFREPAATNAVKKTQSYLNSRLCVELARHAEVRAAAAQSGTLRDTAQNLATLFSEEHSIAALARRFGAFRRGGQDGAKAEKPEPSFYMSLKTIVERAQAKNQPIQFVASTLLLRDAGAASREVCELMAKLIQDTDDEKTLSDLVALCNRTMAHRAEKTCDATV
jgi:hypothetical protein